MEVQQWLHLTPFASVTLVLHPQPPSLLPVETQQREDTQKGPGSQGEGEGRSLGPSSDLEI